MAKLVVYVGSLICSIMFSAVLHAQTFDVSGARAGMTREEIVAQLTTAFGRAPNNESQRTDRFANRPGSYVALVTLEWSSNEDVLEHFEVGFSEMGRAVLINRTSPYQSENRPTIPEMIRAITEKYGRPDAIPSGNPNRTYSVYHYATNPGGRRQLANRECVELWEEVMDYMRRVHHRNESSRNDAFLVAARTSISSRPDISRCGSTLEIIIRFEGGRVGEVEQRLFDIRAFVEGVLPPLPRPRLLNATET